MSQNNNSGKFLALYHSLSAAERRKLREGVQSPFFNKNTKLTQLFALAEKYAEDDLDSFKVKAHKALFAGKVYDDLKMRHLLSKLLQLAEEILTTLGYYNSPSTKQLDLMRLYSDKQLPVHYAHADRGFQKMLESDQAYAVGDYWDQYDYESIQEAYEEQQASRRQNTRLQEQSNALDRFYLLSKLKHACAAVSQQKVFQQPYDIKLIEELQQLAAKAYQDDDLVQLYLLGLNTLEDDAAEKDFEVMKALLAGQPKAAKSELKDLHILAQNFCIRQVNSGAMAYFQELFDLYQISLQQELIQHDPIQFPPAFKNMVSVALRLREFQWAEQFIQHYSQYIKATYREDYLNYNLARVYFEQEQYDEALDHLREMPYQDLFITLNARMLQIKAYIEMGEDAMAENFMDSFKQYLHRRKKVLGYHQANFLNNLRYAKRLIYFNGNRQAREHLLNRIKVEAMLTERNWLLQKLSN